MKGAARLKAKDAFFKVGTGIHRAVFNVSKGRIFGKAFGMPLVELVTIGRRLEEVGRKVAMQTRGRCMEYVQIMRALHFQLIDDEQIVCADLGIVNGAVQPWSSITPYSVTNSGTITFLIKTL
jgi:hypothetical protein